SSIAQKVTQAINTQEGEQVTMDCSYETIRINSSSTFDFLKYFTVLSTVWLYLLTPPSAFQNPLHTSSSTLVDMSDKHHEEAAVLSAGAAGYPGKKNFIYSTYQSQISLDPSSSSSTTTNTTTTTTTTPPSPPAHSISPPPK
ncbi:hypothetical protein STEG23_033110, partial [Scotinomys teguina]